MFCKSNVNKTVSFFLFLLKYRDITTFKTLTRHKKPYFFHLKSKKQEKQVAMTLFHYVSRDISLGNSKSLFA